MTNKDYAAIAKIFSALRATDAPVDWVTVGTIEEALADVFTADDPDFKPERFYDACGD